MGNCVARRGDVEKSPTETNQGVRDRSRSPSVVSESYSSDSTNPGSPENSFKPVSPTRQKAVVRPPISHPDAAEHNLLHRQQGPDGIRLHTPLERSVASNFNDEEPVDKNASVSVSPQSSVHTCSRLQLARCQSSHSAFTPGGTPTIVAMPDLCSPDSQWEGRPSVIPLPVVRERP